ncbi:chitobiase/beta-hexosaminidase C-terminal domain-containing protein [candidate division KSB1 bacterium]|nr:chitobiase/beta-hexosaminidase C-terminal domain-containing protein [candidate division KSB1 bacterium]
MSLNTTTISDRDGDYPDWIEIYNPGQTEIDMTGYGLSDDPEEPFKWIFPQTVLEPNQFKLVFASAKNHLTENPHLHTNFKIKSGGETLLLSEPSGFVADQVLVVQGLNDISWGRQPDGSADWYFFTEPTPAAANSTTGYPAFSPKVEFSKSAGFYRGSLAVELTCVSPQAEIRYTLDSSEPQQDSKLYVDPVELETTTVLRARSFQSGLLAGKTSTHTYFFNEEITLPVVSLSTDNRHLFDSQTGIYVNFWDDWERPVFFEFFETDGLQKVNVDGGIAIGGGATRRRPQKTLRIYFRPQYGYDKINYQIFPDIQIFEFTRLFLRNSGNDWDQTHFRDGLLQTLVKDLNLDVQGYRAVG